MKIYYQDLKKRKRKKRSKNNLFRLIMDENFLIINNKKIDNIDITDSKEKLGDFIFKQYSGLNTENFLFRKNNGCILHISLFKLNGIYYININNEHIIDYKRFKNIQCISQVENNIIIKNSYIGQLKISNCDVELFKKALFILAEWMKKKSYWFTDFLYYFFA
jgi:hypothetical protein